MQALVSFLPPPVDHEVQSLWDELEARFGLRYVRKTPFPHITWQLGEEYAREQAVPLLRELAQRQRPIPLKLDGIGVFNGPSPVVYLRVVKTRTLVRIHRQLHEAMQACLLQPNPFYLPGQWEPHVTLAVQDLSAEQVSGVVDFLNQMQLKWQCLLEDWVLLCQQPDGRAGVEYVFKLGTGGFERRDCA